jgi:ethanolamine utilization microcompartment shell protein EutL
MHTIKLKIDDSVYDELIRHLSKFSKSEIEIVMEEPDFTDIKRYLNAELDEINNGKAVFLSLDEAEQRLENRIKKHEDHL